MHRLRVDALDNKLTVYWDGRQILAYEDTDTGATPNLKGCIGVYTEETSVYLDNILVTRIDDPLGGDYDNDIGGNYNEKIPSYVEEWAKHNAG